MLLTKNETRNCLTCDKSIRGRSDKKFCDDYCRNTYNNRIKSADYGTIRSINSALAKNRRVLQGLLPAHRETTRVTREQLLLKGLSFKYFTHCYVTKSGNYYHFCYEYGYRRLEKDWFMIVRNKED